MREKLSEYGTSFFENILDLLFSKNFLRKN
jgi:hypothetical protein